MLLEGKVMRQLGTILYTRVPAGCREMLCRVTLGLASLCLSTLCLAIECQGQEMSLPNLKTPTLGGKQFWTDHRWQQGWRIQQNLITSHWRLIDPNGIRHAWGTRAACDEHLNSSVPAPATNSKRVIVLIHGLIRSANSMSALAPPIRASLDAEVVFFEYASTRAPIEAHAAALSEVVEGFPIDVEFDFVGHSLGNIVVRQVLGDWQRAGRKDLLERVKHVIMLGPPNQGASIARQLSKLKLYEWIMGQGGMQLGSQWEEFESQLAIPSCPFGIIAGRLPDSILKNPLVDGESDFVVSVEETKLAGATDFLEVPQIHSFLMDDDTVQSAVVNFLNYQSFQSP